MLIYLLSLSKGLKNMCDVLNLLNTNDNFEVVSPIQKNKATFPYNHKLVTVLIQPRPACQHFDVKYERNHPKYTSLYHCVANRTIESVKKLYSMQLGMCNADTRKKLNKRWALASS